MNVDTGKLNTLLLTVFEYFCGMIWLFVFSLMTLQTEAGATAFSAANRLLNRFSGSALPEAVIQFITIVAGVVLPYAIAVIMRPISVVLMNPVLSIFRKRFGPSLVTPAHNAALENAVKREFSLELPAWRQFFLEICLENDKSPLVDRLQYERNRAHVIMQAAIPLAVAILLVISAVQTYVAIALSIGVATTVFLFLAKASIEIHTRWENAVIFAFLVHDATKSLNRAQRDAAKVLPPAASKQWSLTLGKTTISGRAAT
ncbi:MAG TPA: hypothetical protein VJV21_07955 [Pyrinomonadaceae bacterium]|nr:hypothetical protein [Pyrinomonadaceae bacterium]